MLHSIGRPPSQASWKQVDGAEMRLLIRATVLAALLLVCSIAVSADGDSVLPFLLTAASAPLLVWWLVSAARVRVRAAIDGALRRERKRIADELHDFVAHDITVVLMHARALGSVTDREAAEEARQALSRSASRALLGLRRALGVVQGGAGLDVRLRSVTRELEDLGYRVRLTSDPLETATPAALTALEHVVSESATNIIKHASETAEVTITLQTDVDDLRLSIWNAGSSGNFGGGGSAPVASGGTGLVRLGERITADGGRFDSGPADGGWRVTATVPKRRAGSPRPFTQRHAVSRKPSSP